MNDTSKRQEPPDVSPDEAAWWTRDPRSMAWMAEHVADLRRSVSEDRILNLILAIGFAVGLVAHAAGYLLRTTEPAEPVGLLADLLYTLGWALWTGAVVVVFVQVFPERKRRQIERALAAYEDAAGGRKPTGKGSVS
jgi:hypothetical protein